MKKHLLSLFLLLFILSSCELFENAEEDPNELGGSTNVDWAQPGTDFYIGFSAENAGHDNNLMNKVNAIEKDIEITENIDGIVTTKVKMTLNQEQLAALDTLLGIEDLTVPTKLIILDALLGFANNSSLDTTDMENIVLEFETMSKVTSEGLQSFPTNDVSKPFTVIKYDASVGDKYKFTKEDGTEIVREVTYKSKDDDFPWGFMYIKVFKTEEVNTHPFIDKLVYYTNHKFGPVGFEVNLATGKIFKMYII